MSTNCERRPTDSPDSFKPTRTSETAETNYSSTSLSTQAEFWRLSESFRVGRNVDLLQFDCGGEQWVSEVAFPAGSLQRPTGADLGFMEQVLELIEREKIPAPAPIEQRWSSDSASAMSPSHATQYVPLFGYPTACSFLPSFLPFFLRLSVCLSVVLERVLR